VAGVCFSATAGRPTLDEGPLPAAFRPLTLGPSSTWIERADRLFDGLGGGGVGAIPCQASQPSRLKQRLDNRSPANAPLSVAVESPSSFRWLHPPSTNAGSSGSAVILSVV